MRLFTALCFTVLSAVSLFADETIKHQLLMLDESRGQILYVNQSDPQKDWAVKLPDGKAWGIQLIGNNRILTAIPEKGGYCEYDLTTQKVVRDFFDKESYKGAISAIRLPDSRTVLACDRGGAHIYLLDDKNKQLASWDFTDSHKIRQIRRTNRDTLLFGSNEDNIFEINLAGEVLRKIKLDGAKYNYQIIELPNGNLLSAAGYGGFLAEIDKDGKVVRKIGGKPEPAGLLFYFMSQFQVLQNGHIVVATWTGHSAKDSDKGQQIVEFDETGKIVWKWHNPQLAGSIHGVIVLDNLDTGKFYDDTMLK